jgi:SAM-dependent methyltransferase
MARKETSWGKVSSWYNKEVGAKGHFHHENSLLPRVLAVIESAGITNLIDLGCGQGIMERSLPATVQYCGVDISPELISQARKLSKKRDPRFIVADVSKPLISIKEQFNGAVCMLALQNVENYAGFFKNLSVLVEDKGSVVLVLNHPYYRIARNSGWEISSGNGKQVRWVSNYLNEQKIPITMNPGQKARSKQRVTWSFHVPLQLYIKELAKYGFAVTDMEEIASPKESEGRYAVRENTARQEIPLFMILVARRLF